MSRQERLYAIGRQIELICYRTDRLRPGPCRDMLVAKVGRLNVLYTLIVAC